MKKLTSNNSFNGGLITDLSVFNTPTNAVIDSLNMELITTNDDQYLMQNIRGNKKIVDLGFFTENGVDYKYIPLGLKVYNDIAYILAGAFDDVGTFKTGTIGTFPSPDWELLNDAKHSRLSNVFSAFHNFKDLADTPGDYTNPFVSKEFNFEKNKFIDVVIQGDFDRSANVIFTDNKNFTRIINSRFKTVDQYGIYTLAERRGDRDSNIYSNDDWDRISLIQSIDFPITVSDVKVTKEGSLFGGGYKYFFKYVTQEGNTTDILYESSLIPISNDGLGLQGTQISNKQVEFVLSDLDSSYQGIQVYFAHFDGYPKAGVKYFKIDYVYRYSEDTVIIKHNGLESVKEVKIGEINVSFSPIDTAKSIDIINDRLALANIKSTLLEEDVVTMEQAAKTITLWEASKIIDKSYSDAETAANDLGLWKGEVYEYGVVFMLTSKGTSPVFPVVGMDNLTGIQNSFGGSYPAYTLDEEGFDKSNHLINEKGIFRTSFKGKIYTPVCDEEGQRHITYLKADTSSLTQNTDLLKIASGFFIVRRERVKNVLMQGMLIPTIRMPGYKQTSCPVTTGHNRDFIGNFRYTSYYYNEDPTIGLNAKYFPYKDGENDLFSTDFSVVYVPQPTQLINVLTHEKAWAAQGGLGQEISNSDEFGKYVDPDGDSEEKQYLAFYSCEIDLASTSVIDKLTGTAPAIEVQKTLNDASPLGMCEVGIYDSTFSLEEASKLPANIIVKGVESIDIDRADFISIPSDNSVTTFMDSGIQITSDESFSAKIDRVYGYHAHKKIDGSIYPPYLLKDRTGVAEEGTPINYTIRICHDCSPGKFKVGNDDANFDPYSLISQSYSLYLGIKLKTENIPEVPIFNYSQKLYRRIDKAGLPNRDNVISCTSLGNHFINVGHLTNIFVSGRGRWSEEDIVDIFKFDSNKPYYSSTNRAIIEAASVDIFRGDGFISKFYKRTTYKNGVGIGTATAGDAGAFKVGLNQSEGDENDIPGIYTDDKGRNLFDVGQIIEIVTQSNINADIRSTEKVSDKESQESGYDRDFYPHRESLFSDLRPDSKVYNDGYSPNNQVVPYFRISENSSVLNTEFPNRILLSEKNQVQEFYNSFRDLRGFNFRDYGVEYGPIQKIVAVNGALLSVHEKGLLLVGVDDRTLISEGSDIYIDTAKAFSPKAAIISELYGSSHSESVVKTDTTVIGVDYNSDVVWMFVGNKVTVISEFAVKTALKLFKHRIIGADFEDADISKIYTPRIYSTFNSVKHTLMITYVAEDPDNKFQHTVGTLTYNTVLNKWMSRLSEGNKFLMRIVGNEFSFGFSEIYNIWEEDSLINPETGKYVRCRIRDKDYTSEFEIIINEFPTYEKILENIIVLCNKKIPTQLIFRTSGDVNDPAIDIWGDEAATTETVQDIKTREDSSRKALGLGILDQNASYRDSKLYIEVGKVGYSIKDANNKRVRDKHIKVRFIYEGNDELFIQAIISILSISQN